jgi:hypothetical protein
MKLPLVCGHSACWSSSQEVAKSPLGQTAFVTAGAMGRVGPVETTPGPVVMSLPEQMPQLEAPGPTVMAPLALSCPLTVAPEPKVIPPTVPVRLPVAVAPEPKVIVPSPTAAALPQPAPEPKCISAPAVRSPLLAADPTWMKPMTAVRSPLLASPPKMMSPWVEVISPIMTASGSRVMPPVTIQVTIAVGLSNVSP